MINASLNKASAPLSRDAELSAQFSQAAESDTPTFQNRAGNSTSPYVRAQASSPIAWQLFDEEAVRIARKDNKLIFLTIGFKSCHCKFHKLLVSCEQNGPR